jgi:hypothetical protein
MQFDSTEQLAAVASVYIIELFSIYYLCGDEEFNA